MSSAGYGKGEGDEESCHEAAIGGHLRPEAAIGKARVVGSGQGGHQREGYYFVLVLSRHTPSLRLTNRLALPTTYQRAPAADQTLTNGS